MDNKDKIININDATIGEEPSLEEKLEQEKREEERLHMLTKKSGYIPVIHTMESDVYDNIRKDNINKIKILSGQMDTSGNTFEADNVIKRKRLIVIAGVAIFLLLISGAAAYYFLVYKKPVIIEEVKVEAPKYTVLDVWNDPISKKLFSYTSEATSTDDSIVIRISNFDNLYQAILEDENVFKGLAKNKFKYFNLSTFNDVSIKNINMRVADGESGAFVYGYYKKDYIIITSSINRFVEIYESLKK